MATWGSVSFNETPKPQQTLDERLRPTVEKGNRTDHELLADHVGDHLKREAGVGVLTRYSLLEMVGWAGLEPATNALKGLCSRFIYTLI